jgi:hypothetical protein
MVLPLAGFEVSGVVWLRPVGVFMAAFAFAWAAEVDALPLLLEAPDEVAAA